MNTKGVYDDRRKKILRATFGGLAVVLFSVLLCSCSGRYLRTESATTEDIKGTYTLILYGGYYVNDTKTLAVLAKEGTRYAFDVFAPDFDYHIIKGVPAPEALVRAGKFVSFHHAFWKVQWRKIVDTNGEVIGYEARPLYYPLNFGESDILDVYYKKTDDKVIVYIRQSSQLEMMPFEGDRSFLRIR